MPEPISERTKAKVVELYVCHLLTVRKIAERLGIGTGTVSEILKKARKKNPDLDTLRRLNDSLKKAKVSWVEAQRGATMLQSLEVLNIELEDVPKGISFLKKYKERAGIYLEAGARLQKLEGKTGKTYEQILIEYEEKQKSVAKLESQLENMKRREEELSNSIRNLEALKQIQDALDKNNISTNILNTFIKRHKQFEEGGFTLDTASRVASELAKFDMTPEQAARLLGELLRDYEDLHSAVSELGSKKEQLEKFVTSLNAQIRNLDRQLAALNAEKRTYENSIITERAELIKIRDAIQESKQQHAKLKAEQTEHYQAEQKKLEEEISELEAERDSKKHDIDILNQDLKKLEDGLNKIELAIGKNAYIASLALLIEDPVNAGEKRIVLTALTATSKGCQKYVNKNFNTIQSWASIEEKAREFEKVLSSEIADGKGT
ncbi:MAG: hypothetical protein ACE5KA_08770 [Nitrososphaerales archaeon]